MDWHNEPYVKSYTRETDDDLMLSWQALALWRAMLLKFDRSGLLETRRGVRGLAALVRIPFDVVEVALPELLSDGRLVSVDTGYFAPNFMEAQEASKSDKLRQRESRLRRAQSALTGQVSNHTNVSVTNRDQTSRAVTRGHESSQPVTLCSADPDPDPLLFDAAPGASDKLDSKPGVGGKQKSERTRKHALPDGWEPERSTANLAAEQTAKARGVDLDLELTKMRDWASANNAKKADWNSTWRNWTRNAKPSGPGSQRSFGSGDPRQTEIRHVEDL